MSEVFLPTIEQVIATLPQPTPKEMVRRLHEAHDFASAVHGTRRRESGELYIEHDRAVAHSIGEIGIDTVSTTVGLLHDTLQNAIGESDKKKQEMEAKFGRDVTSLVESLNKIAPYISLDGSEDSRKLEKLRRAILHIVDDDIRVLLVRMADNLQDLLMAKHLPVEKRQEIAREAHEIYAPIANRLGIWAMKWRLEDESFRHLKPQAYEQMRAYVSERRAARDRRVNRCMGAIRKKLEEAGVKADVKGRSKHIYSIYRKMQRKNVAFDEIYDLLAVRVIIRENDKSSCYRVLGMVHDMWLPIPEEFDDYIANPKPNGYRSLHTAVYDEDGEIIEVQIRTKAMDDDAERGIAAHWAYKEGGRPTPELARRVKWLRQLLIDLRDEEAEDTPVGERMLNVDDLSQRIYVFTPKREIIELPEGGTPIDFAYQIHTEVGHRCRGAKVNGKMVPLNYPLEQGDTVHIITAKRGGPSRDWMSENAGYARSARTRSKIRHWFREYDRDDNIIRGLEIIERELKRLKIQDRISVADLAQFFKFDDEEDFLAKVGFGDIQFNQISGTIGLLQSRHKAAEESEQEDEEEIVFTPRQKEGLKIQGLSGLHYRMANCCMPVPPEPIVGYITRGRGVSVHRRGCKQFAAHAVQEPGRVIEVSWGGEEGVERQEIPVVVMAYRRPELAEDIAKLVSGRQIKLVRTKSSTDKRNVTTVYIMVQVPEVADLEWLMQKLRNMAHVLDVRRQRWAS